MKQTDEATTLATPLQFVKGVGPHRASQLERKGLRTIEDALFFVPLRHEDRTRLTPFRSLVPGQAATCSGVIVGVSPPPPGRSRVPFTVMLRDSSGYATASWFGWRYLARVLKRGQQLVLHGRVGRYKGAIVLQQPAGFGLNEILLLLANKFHGERLAILHRVRDQALQLHSLQARTQLCE